MDDWFLAELTLIWHANPVYTNIHWYHYVAESRYNGGEVATIAPDYSPSAIHADYHLPVRIGTDAALALSMCKVIVDAGIYDRDFVKEQTDLPLLVRNDTDRFLRGSDVSEGDRDDQFFWLDSRSRTVAPAPRGTLASGNFDPALEGSASSALRDGSRVEVEPVFERLKRLLVDYEPEKASRICGIHPDVIRKLARKVATRKTKIFIGWNSGNYYHGDLMERSMALLLGLTGNWGKKGTGTRSWAIGGWDGFVFLFNKTRLGPEAAREQLQSIYQMQSLVTRQDPTMTTEMVANAVAAISPELGGMGRMMPPAFVWYYQYGCKERWNNPDNHDPSMKRSFDEYMNEAIEKGWFHESYAKTYREVEPRVLFESGEELPVHKETPGHGGPKRRFLMTSGHNRWSIHSMNLINNIIQNTHRGEPFVFINDRDAADLGIGNGERVKLVNDVGEILIAAKLTAACRRVRRSRPPAFRPSRAPPAGGPCTGRRPASRRG